MQFGLRLGVLGLAAALGASSLAAETLAEKTLRDIVVRQKDILSEAEKQKENLDEAWLKGELQAVLNSYDVLVQKSPDFAAAYASYGLLLAKVGMTREAVGMLMQANKLDQEIPLVKNEVARLLAEDGKVAEALPWLTAAVELEPNEPLYHYHLGKLLTEGRDELLTTGQFNRGSLDRAMLAAFKRSAELAPDNYAYAYRAAEAYYDLAEPKWEESLEAWRALEKRSAPGLEEQTIRLHEANVLAKLGRSDEAKALLTTVTEPPLQSQKQTVLDALAPKAEK